MFGYMLFKQGRNDFRTPTEFQEKARQDIENHLRNYEGNGAKESHPSSVGNASVSSPNDVEMVDVDENQNENRPQITHPSTNSTTVTPKNASRAPLLRRIFTNSSQSQFKPPTPPDSGKTGMLVQGNGRNKNIKDTYQPQLTYGSSPLRQTVTTSTFESSDDCSSIDSGKSGCSLSQASAQSLLHQQNESLNRILTNSTVENSLFSNDMNSIYTASTLTGGNGHLDGSSHTCVLSLQEALPHDFTTYYSPDLDVEKFSNGRPVFTKRPLKNWEINDIRSLLIYPELKAEWNNAVPNVKPPQPSHNFKIQIIPNYIRDEQFASLLAESEIYKEAKFDLAFRLKTATYIIERARLRHRQILIDSFNIWPGQFNSQNIINNIQYDCYFKFEWRNIIENYMLNLGIEFQCRTEFKSRISKLKKLTKQKKSNKDHFNNKNVSNLFKKVIIDNKDTNISESVKLNIWKEVQTQVYRSLDMNGW